MAYILMGCRFRRGHVLAAGGIGVWEGGGGLGWGVRRVWVDMKETRLPSVKKRVVTLAAPKRYITTTTTTTTSYKAAHKPEGSWVQGHCCEKGGRCMRHGSLLQNPNWLQHRALLMAEQQQEDNDIHGMSGAQGSIIISRRVLL